MAEAGALTERLANDKGIDAFLLRDTLVELAYLRRKLGEAESAEIDFKAEIERLRAALRETAQTLRTIADGIEARYVRGELLGLAVACERDGVETESRDG